MMEQNPTITATDHAGVRVPPPLLYAVGLGASVLLQALLPLGSWPRLAGMVLALPCLALGLGLCAWSIMLFKRFRTSLVPVVPSAALVTRGPYRFTRNPMYVGLAFIYAGTALWFGLGWGLLLLPVVLVLIHYLVIVREERYLERKFGEAYGRYRARVRRWI
jgi:protein-S-isoprenylcysteine O-methyltransferase Ste14